MFSISKATRKKQKKCIDLLEMAIVKLPEFLQHRGKQESLQLLLECQEEVIALGKHIKLLHGTQTETQIVLEQYYELLDKKVIELQQIVSITNTIDSIVRNTDENYQKLCKEIKRLKDTFEKEFPEKLEIVFLPYNASMWDSLESVWMAAREDENCNAYVIPIPYYDKDEEGKFKEFHYEYELYPDYVPVIDYREYDLELRHPDMIFIHNPYDQYNTVTSILPEYYSSKIKDYTDKLVYIPYFILKEISPEDETEIENMSHFCFLPGTIYADKVIVQSENIRQIYINEYLKQAKEQGLKVTLKELEEKIQGLGSPKYDKVAESKKEDMEIPEEWLQLIQKKDTTWKKIIFYNTSLAAFLKYGDKMLEKIKSVFEIFRENKDEVVLLWRPHPLMKETVSSMRLDLWEQYQDIVRCYKEEGLGIYDDTADLDRAIAISDAYYGDGSSVAYLYQETGKPVMFQNIDIL